MDSPSADGVKGVLTKLCNLYSLWILNKHTGLLYQGEGTVRRVGGGGVVGWVYQGEGAVRWVWAVGWVYQGEGAVGWVRGLLGG